MQISLDCVYELGSDAGSAVDFDVFCLQSGRPWTNAGGRVHNYLPILGETSPVQSSPSVEICSLQSTTTVGR